MKENSRNKWLHELENEGNSFLQNAENLLETKKIDQKFIDNLEFCNTFYAFLKNTEETARNDGPYMKNDEEIIERIRKSQKLQEKIKKYKKAFFKDIFVKLNLINHKQTVLFDECFCEIVKGIMEILEMLQYTKSKKPSAEEKNSIFFFIHFTLYSVLIPNKFETLDKENPGLIDQIKWLKSNRVKISKTM